MSDLAVEDVRAWVGSADFGVSPVEESSGAAVTHVCDPSGALLHLTEWNQ